MLYWRQYIDCEDMEGGKRMGGFLTLGDSILNMSRDVQGVCRVVLGLMGMVGG